MARFKIGDRVKILSVGSTPFMGLEGTIDEILPDSRHLTTLDRYIVIFQWGEKQPFYDVQLEEAKRQSASLT